jgi:hypothetical protein
MPKAADRFEDRSEVENHGNCDPAVRGHHRQQLRRGD